MVPHIGGTVALLLLCSAFSEAGHNNALKHHRLHLKAPRSVAEFESRGSPLAVPIGKRDGQCQFPSDAGLVAVTPNEQNAGWAMSPDQPCKPGSYCPYACPPGEVMAQWDPKATTYSYPASMNGGLFCDKSGKISKPFQNKPYCVDATGPVSVKNTCSGVVSFCQTVLPGNEAMLIPTSVKSSANLAIPGPDYWCSTAAHYYINPPGTDTETACVWGTKDKPIGNWTPYVAGGNIDHSGQTFLKLGWNPIYLEPATPFRNKKPTFGARIECDGCNGLPCEIDPSKNDVNEITGSGTNGAGGGSFCVVTVPKGSKATIVVFEPGSSGSGGGDDGSDSPASSSVSTAAVVSSSTSTPVPSTTSSSSMVASSTEAATTTKAYKPKAQIFMENPTGSVHIPSNSTMTQATTNAPTHSPTGPSNPTTTTAHGAASVAALSVMSLTLSLVTISLFLTF